MTPCDLELFLEGGGSGYADDVNQIGTDSVVFLPCERYKSDQNRIENGMIGTNSAGNG